MKYFITLCLISTVCFTSFAQNREAEKAERLEKAKLTAATLENEGLIVRIPTNARKIAGMREVLVDGKLSEVNRGRLKERLATTIAETEQQAKLITKIFRETYNIGPVYFIPDTALVLLKEEQASGYFYNENLEIDPEITLPDDFVLLRIGYVDVATGSGAEALILTYSDLLPLQPPFPDAVTFNNMGYLFNKMLAPDIAERKRFEAVINKLTKRLHTALEGVEEE